MTEQTSASARVFSIAELLELILLELSIKELLISQRVARNWQRTIANSRSLLQKLFLAPAVPVTRWSIDITDGDSAPSQTYVSTGNTTRVLEQPYRADDPPQAGVVSALKARLNPLLVEPGNFQSNANQLVERIRRGEAVAIIEPYQSIAGAGRRMFLSQPPCQQVYVWLNWGVAKSIKNAKGVTAGDVLREVAHGGPPPYLPRVYMRLIDVICPVDGEVPDVK